MLPHGYIYIAHIFICTIIQNVCGLHCVGYIVSIYLHSILHTCILHCRMSYVLLQVNVERVLCLFPLVIMMGNIAGTN